MKLVSIKELSVRYRSVEALHGVDLDIYRSDFIGVTGPNGGGKTSLVKAMLKAVPYSGTVTYAPEIESRGIRHIGYLPQINDMDKAFPISAGEVVLSGLQGEKKLFKRYTKADKIDAGRIMELCGVSALARRPVGELSGGQFQRVLLGRALISDPKLLILDEPTNFVDNEFEKELYEMLGILNEKMAIVMVSHDPGAISSHVKSILYVNGSVRAYNSNLITAEQPTLARGLYL